MTGKPRDRVVPELKKRGLNLILGGHTVHTWMPDTYFAAHPAWFAYTAGERKAPALCLSNEEMAGELLAEIGPLGPWHCPRIHDPPDVLVEPPLIL